MSRQQDVTRKVVVPLKEVQERLPRNSQGDPAFIDLNQVLSVFSREQVVVIVNRWLYQAEYQQKVHVERAARVREQEKPVKEAFKRLFPHTSFINATEEQIEEAVREAFKEKGSNE